MAASTVDPYATLGIPPGSSRAEAARAHRRLAKQFHPDVNPGPGAAERMRRVNEAWRILSRMAPSGAGTWTGSASAFGPRAGAATWTTWPEDRVSSVPRARRPARPDPVEPTFGDRPAVFVAVWVFLGLLFFIGTWLGSITP